MDKKISLILGGGGVRCYTQIGVLKVLEKKQIKINEVIGSSFGSLIGVCFASGKTAKEIENMFTHVKVLRFLDPVKGLGTGLIKGEKLVDYVLDEIKCKKFSDLKIPFKTNALDINSGKEKVLNKGSLREALLAAIALPGVIPPKKIGTKYYMDGGIYNPLPVHLVGKKMNKIIAIDVVDKIPNITDKTNKVIILQQWISLPQIKNMNETIKKCKVKLILLSPLKKPMNVLDFRYKNMFFSINRGMQEAKKVKL